MALETQEVDIHALMSSVLTLTRERARNQNLDARVRLPDRYRHAGRPTSGG